MISDSIYYEGAEKVYTRTGFFDAANQARTQNQLLTFAEYTAREDAKNHAEPSLCGKEGTGR